jgi:hypothetical protein
MPGIADFVGKPLGLLNIVPAMAYENTSHAVLQIRSPRNLAPIGKISTGHLLRADALVLQDPPIDSYR